jgi:hypothetical protein
MKGASKLLLVAAELSFMFSLALPALEINVLGKASVWEGWRATAVTIGMLSEAAKDPTLFPLGSAGLGNVVFAIAPWLLWFGRSSRRSLGTFACVVVGAASLAVWAPHSLLAGSPRLLVGYFVWLLAYAALLGSIVLRQGAFLSDSGFVQPLSPRRAER